MLVPMLAASNQSFRLEVDRGASRGDHFASSVKQCNGIQFFRLEQIVERGLHALFRNNRTKAPLRAHDQAERVGNIFGAVSQGGLSGLVDATVLGNLPAGNRYPRGNQYSINKRASANHFGIKGSLPGVVLIVISFWISSRSWLEQRPAGRSGPLPAACQKTGLTPVQK